jgi:hypothetical protein
VTNEKEAEERAVNNDIPSVSFFTLFFVEADLSFLLDGRFIQQHMEEPTMRITLLDDPLFDVADVEKGKNEE